MAGRELPTTLAVFRRLGRRPASRFGSPVAHQTSFRHSIPPARGLNYQWAPPALKMRGELVTSNPPDGGFSRPRLAALTFRLWRKLAHRCGIQFLTRVKQFTRFASQLAKTKTTFQVVLFLAVDARGIEPLSRHKVAVKLFYERTPL